MNKFSDKSRCVKCGNTRAQSLFTFEDFGLGKKEVIKRTCTNCGYFWHELPIDTEVENDSTKIPNK